MPARLVFSERDRGDLRVDGDPAELARVRHDVLGGEWTWLRQVHGAEVVVVPRPGAHAGVEADAAVTAVAGAVLAVHTADCVPVLLHADEGVVGAAHVGWRGLVAGVLEATIAAMRDLGAGRCVAHVGPHIRARCYEFGPADLDEVAARYGDAVRATTAQGTPALDLLAGIRSAIAAVADAELVRVLPGCTACEPGRFFSHRARGDRGRHAAAIRLEP